MHSDSEVALGCFFLSICSQEKSHKTWVDPCKVILDQVLKVFFFISHNRSSAYYFTISLRNFSRDRTEVGGRNQGDHMIPFLGVNHGRRESLVTGSSFI